MSCKSRNIYSFCLFNDTNLWISAHEYLVDMRYECRVTNMMKLIVSWIDVSNLLDLNFWQSRFDSHCFELWVFYTRFLLNIEVFWDDQYSSYALQQKFIDWCIRMLYSWDLKNHCDRDFRIENHSMIWRITVIVIFASNILSFFSISSQFALKTWKSSSWMTQKKHDLMTQLLVVFSIESLISYNSRFSIWWLTANWMTMRSEFESIHICLFSIFLFHISESMSWSKKRESLNAKDVVIAIAFDISDFENFLDFLFLFHHYIRRSVRSNINLWRCFWRDSVFHAS